MQLGEAIDEQKRTGERLDRVMVRMGFVGDNQVLEAIGRHFEMPIVDLEHVEVDEETLRTLPPKLVFKQRCVPIARDEGVLKIATSDPFELSAFDELRLLTGLGIELVLADERDLAKFIRSHYGVAGDTLEALSTGDSPTLGLNATESTEEIEQAQEASVVKLVNDLLLEAIRERATDVHIEPFEEDLDVRYRIDGILGPAGVPQTINRFRNAIVSRLKIMANLNIAEKTTAAGRSGSHFAIVAMNTTSDSRSSRCCMAKASCSESWIKARSCSASNSWECRRSTLARWDDLIARPHGILLVTGPTGSGKSTTLYASLTRIVSDAVKAITVEDPVEYQVEGVNQIQVNAARSAWGSPKGLRSILRHDPDIIMIGEIRDRETADAAVQASLTGHLVFSTLHTNDAAGAATRLLDMGIEPFLVASAVEGVMAQRLLQAGLPRMRTANQRRLLGPPTRSSRCRPRASWSRALAAGNVGRTGYQGRMGIFELLRLTPATRDLDHAASSHRANHRGMPSKEGELNLIQHEAYRLAADHRTTLAEAIRVCRA